VGARDTPRMIVLGYRDGILFIQLDPSGPGMNELLTAAAPFLNGDQPEVSMYIGRMTILETKLETKRDEGGQTQSPSTPEWNPPV